MSEPRPPTRFAWDTADFTVFDPVIAHAACWASYYAYYDAAQDFLIKLMGATSLRQFAPDPTTGRPGGYIVFLPDANLVVFAGTTDAPQLYGIIRDAVFGGVTNQPGMVNAMYGVAGWAESLMQSTGSYLTSVMQSKKTVFAGHSIGGALAVTLLAALIGQSGFTSQSFTFYTFGSPRAGNESFASRLSGGFSVINTGDPIPKLPGFGYLRLGNPQATPPSYTVCPPNYFTNCGTLVYLRPGTEAEIVAPGDSILPKDSPIEWDATRFAAELFGQTVIGDQPRKVVKAWNDSIAAHECHEYLSRLEGLLPVVSGQHATMGMDAKKAESQLPPPVTVDDGFHPILGIKQPPPVSGPAGPASQGVVPLHARRRH